MKSMSEERSQHLIKCAMQVADLMSIGVDPNAALFKVASDEALNAEEVKRVSEATNNAKTISVLASSKPEDKSNPFPLTNADEVNEKLWSKNPDAEHEGKDDTSGNFDAQKTKSKKVAAAESNQASRVSYLDVAAPDYAATLREACGFDTHAHKHQKFAAVIGDDCSVSLHVENTSAGHTKTASADSRMVGNPYAALDHVKHMCDEARLKYASDSDDATNLMVDVADSFRLTTAPKFARVEKIAQHMGVPSEVIDIIYEYGNLAKLGEKRAEANVKLASETDHNRASCSAAEVRMAEKMVQVTALMKHAADALATYTLLEEGRIKTAADINNAVKHVSSEMEALPGRLSGADFDHSKAVNLIGNATGTLSDAEPKPMSDTGPLDTNTRQELANNDTAASVQRLMGDSFIGGHPIAQVVDAFNRIRSVNPNLGDAELQSLVKHDLSTEGNTPFDTLHRARANQSK